MIDYTQNPTDLLLVYMNKWRYLVNVGRKGVSASLLSHARKFKTALYGLGVRHLLDNPDITEHDVKMFGQRLYRNLGAYPPQKADARKFFDLLPVIVAEMPENLRVEFLNKFFKDAGLVFHSTKTFTSEGRLSVSDALKYVNERSSSLLDGLLDLADGIDPGELEAAHNQAKQLLSVVLSVLLTVEGMIHERDK